MGNELTEIMEGLDIERLELLNLFVEEILRRNKQP